MIRHEIEDLPHAVRVQGFAEARKALVRADLGIEGVVIGDVVAMRASGPRL